MEKKLAKMFEYQRFEQNSRLSAMIEKAEALFSSALSDDDLMMVNAAGNVEIANKKESNR